MVGERESQSLRGVGEKRQKCVSAAWPGRDPHFPGSPLREPQVWFFPRMSSKTTRSTREVVFHPPGKIYAKTVMITEWGIKA